jgi:hypothetical protein
MLEFRVSKKTNKVEVSVTQTDPYTKKEYTDWRPVDFDFDYACIEFKNENNYLHFTIKTNIVEVLTKPTSTPTQPKTMTFTTSQESDLENLLATQEPQSQQKFVPRKKNKARLQNVFKKKVPLSIKDTPKVTIFGKEQTAGYFFLSFKQLGQQRFKLSKAITDKNHIEIGSILKINYVDVITNQKTHVCYRVIYDNFGLDYQFSLAYNTLKTLQKLDVDQYLMMVEVSTFVKKLEFLDVFMSIKDNQVISGIVTNRDEIQDIDVPNINIREVMKRTQLAHLELMRDP